MRLNLVTGSCLFVIGCTFPIKNDRIDTAVEEEDFSDFGQVEVLEIDNCDVDQLKTFIEFRTGGEIVSSLSEGQNGQVWAVIGNQCKNEINFTTNSGCLYESWVMEGGGFVPAGGDFVCSPEPVPRTLRSGQAFQRLITVGSVDPCFSRPIIVILPGVRPPIIIPYRIVLVRADHDFQLNAKLWQTKTANGLD